MTRDEAIKKHREMWNWLAENPGKKKEDYLKEFDPKANLMNNCYLCEYAAGVCQNCPLEWQEESCCAGGLYDYWWNAMKTEGYIVAAEMARQIAELPEKEERV